MQIHEYQAKELFSKYNIPYPFGYIAYNVKEAVEKSELLGSYPLVIKAQIHAGGRGKAGGVKIVINKEALIKEATEMLGKVLVTPQTGPSGIEVKKYLISFAADIKTEIYLSLITNRETTKITIIASSEGGVEIEQTAELNPEKIIKIDVDPDVGLQGYHIRKLFYKLNVPGLVQKDLFNFVSKLYKLFVENDCMTVEINPLSLRSDNVLEAVDAKIELDSNALMRHPELLALRDPEEIHPLENRAFKYGITYINIDDTGHIGSMVNGAGLAMATLDSILLENGKPANFLDVGGNASSEMICEGLQIILGNKNIKCIFVNIFGGILRCDTLANGLIDAANKIDINVPLIVRLNGTNAKEGNTILDNSGLNIFNVKSIKEGAKLSVSISKE